MQQYIREVSWIVEDCQNMPSEIIAEFSAAALSCMLGKKSKLGNSYEYLQHYSRIKKLTVENAYLCLLSEIKDVLKLISETEGKESRVEQYTGKVLVGER